MDARRQRVKDQWIAMHKADPTLDYDIIFKDDEDIHENVKAQFSFRQQGNRGDPNATQQKKSGKDYSDHSKMTDEDWSNRFDDLLDLYLIRVPEDHYEDKLTFTDPEELKEIFAKIEEDNLQKIHQMQEQEQFFEALLKKEKQIHTTLQSNYDQHNKTYIELEMKINAAKSILSTFKKKPSESVVEAGAPETTAASSSDKNKSSPVDYTKFLKELRAKIQRIHEDCIRQGEADSKPTLVLLNVSSQLGPAHPIVWPLGNREQSHQVHAQHQAAAQQG